MKSVVCYLAKKSPNPFASCRIATISIFLVFFKSRFSEGRNSPWQGHCDWPYRPTIPQIESPFYSDGCNRGLDWDRDCRDVLALATLTAYQWVAFSLGLRRIVVQVGAEPSLDFGDAHALTLAVVVHLIAVNFSQTEITRFGVGEVETAYAGTGPHCKRFRNQHSRVLLHIE